MSNPVRHPGLQLAGVVLLLGCIAPALSAERPIIKTLGKSDCYQPGDTIELLGKGFGRNTATRQLVLQDNRQRQEIKNIKSWQASRISGRLPETLKPSRSQTYLVGIVDNSRWISNRDRQITLCKTEVFRKPTSASSLLANPPPDSKPIEIDTLTSNPVPPQNVDDTDSSTRLNQKSQNLSQSQSAAINAPNIPSRIDFKKTGSSTDSSSIETKEVIVVTSTREEAQALEQLIQQYGISVKRRSSYSGLGMVVSVLRIPSDYATTDVVEQLTTSYPEFTVDFNHRYQLLTSNSEAYSDPKHWAYKMMQWTSVNQNCHIRNKIGIIDTGIAETNTIDHSRIRSKSMLSFGVKAAAKNHGTAIASLLIGSPGLDIPGLLPEVTLYSAGIFRQRNENKTDTTAELILKALNWMAEEEVSVINLSLGGPHNRAVEIAIQRLLETGRIIVSAAGIDAQEEALHPAAQEGVIAVTAVDASLKPFSNRVAGDYVDFAAPGVDLWLLNEKGKGRYLSGSSFAAPVVAASYALLNINPETHDLLKNTARDLGKPGRDEVFGWGLPRAQALCKKNQIGVKP